MITSSDSLPIPDSLEIVPLERLTLPVHLDGSMSPRGSAVFPCRIDARNDVEAIGIWLAEVAKTNSSFRSYRLEAERCLLWATVTRGKPLSALNNDDISAYAQFLRDPQPREQWLSAGAPRRGEKSWRPFRTPLSLRTSGHALGILAALFAWLHTAGYVRENPWYGPATYLIRTKERSAAPALAAERNANVVSAIEWSWIRKALDDIEMHSDGQAAAKSRAVLYLAYYGDLKPGEICSLRMSSISVLDFEAVPIWKLDIEGRPKALREIILLPPVQQALEHYLHGRGIALGDDRAQADPPLIASSRGMPDWPEVEGYLTEAGGRSSTGLVFSRAAELAQDAGDSLAARRLSGATIQWLKHALEVHTVHGDVRWNWCWHLIGACWLSSLSFKAYLPPRIPLSGGTILQAFDAFQEMW
jgi:integrase/recombinase XerD